MSEEAVTLHITNVDLNLISFAYFIMYVANTFSGR